jgi:phosphoribosylanthranilate isomerase
MILSKKGPRALDLARARDVRAAIPSGVLAVGVFVNEPPQRVNEIASELQLDVVQLHGLEGPEGVAAATRPVVKTIGVPAGDWNESQKASLIEPYARRAAEHSAAWALLFDTTLAGESGGTGRTFPWEILNDARLRAVVPEGRLLVAGGLNPENVALALERVKPYAVDIASGVESSPGVKDRGKLERLFASVRPR